VSSGAVAARVVPIPGVRSFTYDRSFPHTLRIVVRREVPVLVVRRVPGREAFLVGASGRVIRMLPHPRLSHMPRLWVTKAVDVQVGSSLPPTLAAAATALAPLRGAALPGGVAAVRVGKGELTLQLGGGLEVRLGDTGDLRLKLAIARRILRATDAAAGGSGYLDVSVLLRPVLDRASSRRLSLRVSQVEVERLLLTCETDRTLPKEGGARQPHPALELEVELH
jgi:hypothetical protein